MAFCTYCGELFSREEDLETHVSTHPEVHPYKCHICHISFTRDDLLQRHYLSHNSDEGVLPPQATNDFLQSKSDVNHVSGSAPRAPFLAVACDNCFKAKVKCDHRYPCERCSVKQLTCVPRSPAQSNPAETAETTRASREYSSNTSTLPHDANFATGQQWGSREGESGGTRISPVRVNTASMPVSGGPAQIQAQNATLPLPHQNQSEITSRRESVLDGWAPAQMITPPFGLPESGGNEPYVTAHHRNWHDVASTGQESQTAQHRSPQTVAQNFMYPDVSAGFNFGGNPSTSRSDAFHSSQFGTGRERQLHPEAIATASGALAPNPHTAMSSTTIETNDTDSIPATISMPDLSSTDPVGSAAAAESEEHTDWAYWWICRCTSTPLLPPTAATDEAMSMLVRLDESFADPGPWSCLDPDWRKAHFQPTELFANVAIAESTREWMLVVLQHFWRITVELHGVDFDPPIASSLQHPQDDDYSIGFPGLPPTEALNTYIELFLSKFEPHYRVLPARSLNPNKFAMSGSGRGSILLLLLMVAFGSMFDPALKARRFSAALTETCRISMIDISYKDPNVTVGGLFLTCALVLIIKGSFSGTKLHMSVSVTHRHIYLTMMRHAGFFDKSRHRSLSVSENKEAMWKAWLEQESASRLAYSWVLIDQEVSLFYDLPPILSVTELDCPLPSSESTWLASSPDEWIRCLKSHVLCATGGWSATALRQSMMSLRELFERFDRDQLFEPGFRPELLQMRLLLFPLQILVTNLSQTFSYIPEGDRISTFYSSSSILQFEDIQLLMHRWLTYFRRAKTEGVRDYVMAKATLILYHVINLSLFTAFDKLESFARGETPHSSSREVTELPSTCLREPEKAFWHCDQILRAVGELKIELWPAWTAAAIYRATIVLWAISLCHIQGSMLWDKRDLGAGNTDWDVRFDAPLEPGLVSTQSVSDDTGVPHIVASDGSRVSLDNPHSILKLGLDTIYPGCRTSAFTDGIKCRLEAMSLSWEDRHQRLVSLSYANIYPR